MIWKKLRFITLIWCGLALVLTSHALAAKVQPSSSPSNSVANLLQLNAELEKNNRSKSSGTHNITHRCSRTEKYLRICAHKRRIRFGLGKQDIASIDWHISLSRLQGSLGDGKLTDTRNSIFGRHLVLYRSMRIRI